MMKLLGRIELKQSFLVADDGQFLGKLTSNSIDIESILNTLGKFGSQYSTTSIKNRFSQYGSPFSSLSPYNGFTNTPPTIYLKGMKYGYLTKNKYKFGIRVDPDLLLDFLKDKNLNF
jgi:hypothetical protein